jgi:quinol monooxygenase YgiN
METSDPIITVARWHVNPGAVATVLELLVDVRRQSQAEPGCLGYEVFTRVGETDELLLLERYADVAALQAHRESMHYRNIVQGRILPLLSDRQVEVLKIR